MGYVSFREGMFFLHTLGFLTKDLRGIECQNDVPNKDFQHHHPRLGVTKCWFCPWVFIDDGSRWACFRAQNTSALKYWNWFLSSFLQSKHQRMCIHIFIRQATQNCLVFLVFVFWVIVLFSTMAFITITPSCRIFFQPPNKQIQG